jgi:hypothetical protein
MFRTNVNEKAGLFRQVKSLKFKVLVSFLLHRRNKHLSDGRIKRAETAINPHSAESDAQTKSPLPSGRGPASKP